MLPKAHFTSHSRMSGSRLVITPSWLSGSWISSLYSSSVYSCHLFLISSASLRSIQFLSFTEPMFTWNVSLVSLIFLKRSLSLSHSIVFLYFSALISEAGFLFSPCYSLKLHSNGYIFTFLLCLSRLFYSQFFVRFPQTTILCFLYFFSLQMVLIPVSCTMSWTSIHSSSDTLSIRSSPLNLFLTSTV